MQRGLTDKNLEYEIIEWICQNDKDFNEAKLHGYDLRMEESEIIYWMKKYADYKSRLAENLVRQGVPQPVFACGRCKHYKKDVEYNSLGNCNNPEVMGSRMILGHCDEFFLTEDFGCRFYEES